MQSAFQDRDDRSHAVRAKLFPRPLSHTHRSIIDGVLDRFPDHLIARLSSGGTKIIPLNSGERYLDASHTLRQLSVDIDAWPLPPAGLFVVADRTLYLRAVSAMSVGHELGHAVDAELGGGQYLSNSDPLIRSAFSEARDFVTPYAACGRDEYLAEGIRAFCEINDPGCPWAPVSQAQLHQRDPRLFAIISRIFTPPADFIAC
jgi:hypothetical protein